MAFNESIRLYFPKSPRQLVLEKADLKKRIAHPSRFCEGQVLQFRTAIHMHCRRGMRFPIIRQRDATDCGPATLAMISAYYRKHIPIASLRELAGTDRQGTHMAGLRFAAEQVGFQTRAVRASPEALRQILLPAVAHWRENDRHHFVVLYKVSAKRITVGDPARGLRRLSPNDFGKRWTGVLLLLTPTVHWRDTT